MILTLEYFVKPQAHQSFRIGRNGIKYKPKKIVDYQTLIQHLTLDQLPKDFNIIPSGTNIFVNYIEYVYAYPSSMAKYKRQTLQYKATKPDLQDNLNKAFFDSLEGLIFEQDQNIVVIYKMSKVYGENNKIRVQFEWEL